MDVPPLSHAGPRRRCARPQEMGHSVGSASIENSGQFRVFRVGIRRSCYWGDNAALEETLGANQAADRGYSRQRQVECRRRFIANRSQ